MGKQSCFIIVLICLSKSVFSADSVDLQITGTIINPACTLMLDNTVIDFGHVNYSSMNAHSPTQLGSKKVNLTITCSGAAMAGFNVVDGRRDSLPDNLVTVENAGVNNQPSDSETLVFGLGRISGERGNGLGVYTIAVDTPTADGTRDTLIYRKGSMGNWQSLSSGLFNSVNQIDTVAIQGTTVPVPFNQAIFPLKITAALDSTTHLGSISEDTKLDGQATFNIIYI